LQSSYDIARNNGERRGSLFAQAVSLADEGLLLEALGPIQQEYELATEIADATAGAGDLTNMGNIQLEKGNTDQATTLFADALDLVLKSDLTDEVKDNARRGFLFNSARIALALGQNAEAKTKAADYLEQAEAHALAELAQANQQDPYNLYRRRPPPRPTDARRDVDGLVDGQYLRVVPLYTSLPTRSATALADLVPHIWQRRAAGVRQMPNAALFPYATPRQIMSLTLHLLPETLANYFLIRQADIQKACQTLTDAGYSILK
jgi:tetratricopeptide (TPR) repeat protein